MGNLDKVKSVVTLMLENRSLDNILGYLYAPTNKSPNGDAFDGLTGNESNSGTKVRKITKPTTTPTPDPGEEYAHVNVQLFDVDPPPNPPNATNSGFVDDYNHVGGKPAQIMSCYDPGVIPNLAEICRRYAVCDAWYASVPSQTWTNRAFAHAATSWGMVNNAPDNPFKWRMPTIFQRMAAVPGYTWRIYYDENYASFTRLQFSPLLKPGYAKNIVGFEHFLNDANAGQFPAYSFVEPNFFHNPLTGKRQSDLHPPSDIVPGDAFIARVFNAIVTSPQWAKNEVLLIITFDEHGGCYDHVAPPTNAVAPDNKKGEFGFDFKRFGVRVPAVIVSPFVRKGSVFHAPPGATPYDHTSILATMRKLLPKLPPFSKREQAAPDLDAVLSGPARKGETPLPVAPPAPAPAFATKGVAQQQPLNDLQKSMVNAMKQVMTEKAPAAAAKKGIAAAKAIPPAAAMPVQTVDDAFDFFKEAKQATGL
ncbi:MAG TPA: alkaline phosphatase family protein [Thermoanaerobaculia bacterium]|nr:alkaline phosphatase family protein [Thermoanaerobaculia bacterium]